MTRIYSGPEGFLQLIEQFEDGVQAFSLNDFREYYTTMQWRELVPRLREAGFSQARVRLKVEPSDQMRQYLAAGEKPASLPARIVESQDAHAIPKTHQQETARKSESAGKRESIRGDIAGRR